MVSRLSTVLGQRRPEVVSPGGLFPGMTEADLGTTSVPRNRLLFRLLHRMDAVEQIGSGIRHIRELCREHRVAEPRIETSEHWVTTTFPRPDLETVVEAGRDEPRGVLPGTPQVTPPVAPQGARSVVPVRAKRVQAEVPPDPPRPAACP